MGRYARVPGLQTWAAGVTVGAGGVRWREGEFEPLDRPLSFARPLPCPSFSSPADGVPCSGVLGSNLDLWRGDKRTRSTGIRKAGDFAAGQRKIASVKLVSNRGGIRTLMDKEFHRSTILVFIPEIAAMSSLSTVVLSIAGGKM